MKILCAFGRFAYGDPARGESYEHANFLPALRANGWDVVLFDSWDRNLYADFADLNRRFVEIVRIERPQIVFLVPMLYEIWTETLDLLRQSFPVSIVAWGTDDSWKFDEFTRFIASHVDVYATTYESAAGKAQALGLRNLVVTQWGISRDRLHAPLPARACRFPVSFVGAAYGNRRSWIAALEARGIKVHCFGHGWEGGVIDGDELSRVIRESVISLNFADSPPRRARKERRYDRQIKARTFDVPGQGGFLLSERADGLDACYVPGEEIVIFEEADDLGASIHRYLADGAGRDRIAEAGYRRTVTEHTYERRFEVLFSRLPAVASDDARRWDIPPDALSARFEVFRAKHRANPAIRLLASASVMLCSTFWGRNRGRRVARRLVYELSWRLAGGKTYSAAGWPGRMFYARDGIQ